MVTSVRHYGFIFVHFELTFEADFRIDAAYHGIKNCTNYKLFNPKKRRGQAADWRQQLEVWRFLEERDLDKLRGELIEPFSGHWKAAFELDRVPFQGKAAEVFLLLALGALLLGIFWRKKLVTWYAVSGLAVLTGAFTLVRRLC